MSSRIELLWLASDIGPAGVDESLHMVFRAPDSPPIAALREELLSLSRCPTDQSLYNLALAASYNGKTAWLAAAIDADRQSPLAWRQKRALVLAGFTIRNALPVAGAWPDRQIRTDHDQLRQQSAARCLEEACAHHWWHVYLAAATPTEAYAAWILFLHAADRRAWVWMREDVQRQNISDAFLDRKLKHVELNRQNLKRAMEKRLEKLDKKFLGHDTVVGIGPWGKAESR